MHRAKVIGFKFRPRSPTQRHPGVDIVCQIWHTRFMRTIDYYRKRRKVAIIALGGKCAECGWDEYLEIDHIDPATKTINLGKDWYNDGWWGEVLTKCQLLCELCHKKKSSAESSARMLAIGFTHGSIYGWMKKKCKCLECEIAKRDWNDKRNAKRRAQVAK